MKTHRYSQVIEWTGNNGPGTTDYRSYERSFNVQVTGKPTLLGSSDTPFRGDATKYNPEDMLVSAIASCHMLWYLHVCADAGIVVSRYRDEPEGLMHQESDGSGRFVLVRLRPRVYIGAANKMQEAIDLHQKAHAFCFIANSVNFEVRIEPEVHIAG